MSKYPRIGSTQKREKNVSAKCKCGAIAKLRLEVEVSYMRGDDEFVWACEQHKKDLIYLMEPEKK